MDEDLKGRPVGARDFPDLTESFFTVQDKKAFVCSRSFISQCMIGILVKLVLYVCVHILYSFFRAKYISPLFSAMYIEIK